MKAWRKGLAAIGLLALLATAGCGNGGESDNNNDLPDPGIGDGDDFNLDLGLELLRLCLQSYQMLEDFQNGVAFTLPAPYTLVQIFNTDEPYEGQNFGGEVPIAFVATQGTQVYVVFRGTQTITEWIANAKIAQVKYTFTGTIGESEEGFSGVYQTLHADILATLKTLAASGNYQTLYVTGHSLGGALATLAAPAYAAESGFSDPVTYSFASPRVGNPVFADDVFDTLVKTGWRVANTNDLAPTVPLVETVVFIDCKFHTFIYEHVDTEYAITFGNPVTGPTDIPDIEFNHSSCNYYGSLCDQSSDPAACKAEANGLAGCSF